MSLCGICKKEFWLIIILFLLLAACSQDEKTREIETLNIAVLPDQSEVDIRNKYLPLLNYLYLHTGLKTKLLIPKSYQQLLQWFDSQKVDLALFGGVTFVEAHVKSNAIPLVMRDVDENFSSVVLVQANNPATSLEGVKDASLAFGSRLSTSGHFMPRYFFQQQNIIPEVFFSNIKYSGAHDRTAEWVSDGIVDVGVVNSVIINQMFFDGRLSDNQVKVIWRSPAYADYVWAVQANISREQSILIRDAFLYMNHNDDGKLLLEKLGANYYIPASVNDFNRLSQTVFQMKQEAK